MNWRSTWILLGAAAAVLVFILLVERRYSPTSIGAAAPKRILALSPAQVTNIQLRVTNQLVARVERSASGGWNFVSPITYPAQVYAIEGLLQNLAALTTLSTIAPEELASRGRTLADFGLDVPQATLTLLHGGTRTEVLFGSKSLAGDQVYLQLLNQPLIYLVPSDIMNRLPRQANDWRDATLLNFAALTWDRLEVRQPGRGFGLQLDPTNKFNLFKPIVARADAPKVEALLRKLVTTRVQQFVNDDPRADLEPYGLQPPEAELALNLGTNEVALVQFGKSPTNDPNLVYARRMSEKNVVLVPKSALESIQVSANDLRDRHLFSFSTNEVDTMEVLSAERFSVRRQGNGLWMAIEPQATMIDSELMRGLLTSFLQMEGTIEKDLVTDFTSFGLAQPSRQFTLKTTLTNAAGATTNRIVAQLALSEPQEGKVFVRRGDENLTVYSIPASEFEALPSAAWQLRDRRVWTFTTNQVVQVAVKHGDVTRTVVRSPAGKWSLGEGSQGMVNPDAIEELMYRLGELRAESWIARGDGVRGQYGFNGDGATVTIELKVGEKPYRLTLELGSATAAKSQYTLTTIDGQTWVFKFPFDLYMKLLRDVITPLLRNSGN